MEQMAQVWAAGSSVRRSPSTKFILSEVELLRTSFFPDCLSPLPKHGCVSKKSAASRWRSRRGLGAGHSFCFVYLSEIVNISERYIRWFGVKDHFPPRGNRISMWAGIASKSAIGARAPWKFANIVSKFVLGQQRKKDTSFRSFDINFSFSTRRS